MSSVPSEPRSRLGQGKRFEFSPGGVLNLDGRALYFCAGVGSSPVLITRSTGPGR